ncbi:MAG: FAD-binding domain [Thermomicrobiales bacterium]|nr:FAD-binding domain [Thermomicrobiales bacterium]
MRIAISGAGIAGSALAFWLSRCGHQPTLIEKAPRPRTGGYLIDFWGVGYEVAERMGLAPALRDIGYPVQEVRLVDDQGRRVSGFPVAPFRRALHGRFISLPRGDLAATISRAVEGGLETIYDQSIAAIEEHDRGVRVAFTRGAPWEFDLVIGADGLHSTVRGLAFGPERQFEHALGYHVAAFEVAGYRPRDELVYVSHTRPGLQLARFALRDDRTLVFGIFADHRMNGPEPRGLDERKALLRHVFHDAGWEAPRILQAMDGVDEIYLDRVSQIRMDHWSRGRVMLIGDAAACVSLLAGEGTGLAMTEAYVLAGELHRARGDYREAFRRHEERLRAFVAGKQAAAERFAPTFVPRTPFALWRRNQALKLLALPPLANFLIGRSFQDDFALPDYGMEAG